MSSQYNYVSELYDGGLLRHSCAYLNFKSASSMAARASSIESWEPVWIWRFRNFSVNLRRDGLYGGPCTIQKHLYTLQAEQQHLCRLHWGALYSALLIARTPLPL